MWEYGSFSDTPKSHMYEKWLEKRGSGKEVGDSDFTKLFDELTGALGNEDYDPNEATLKKIDEILKEDGYPNFETIFEHFKKDHPEYEL